MSGAAIVAVYAVFGSDAEAREIGRAMVERRLAACVNILGRCDSIYRWQDEVVEAEEFAALFKTGSDKAETLVAAIGGLHSYDTPAIVVWPIAIAHSAYEDWVIAETR